MGQTGDDGLDGLVYLRMKKVNAEKPNDKRGWRHEFTGGLIHVQVKSGASYRVDRAPDHFEIRIRDMNAKRELWQKSPLPVALIYVEENDPPEKGWWADLKADASYTDNGTVIVPKKNRFEPRIECRRPFARLASGQHRRLGLEEMDMSEPAPLPGRLNQMTQGTKHAAWGFYRRWKSAGAVNPELGAVIINRTGWSHMTRVGRPVSRIQASFELLPAAARIVATIRNWQVLRRGKTIRSFADGSWAVYDYLGLSAMVKWTARAPSEVMVILKRQTILATDSAATNPDRKVQLVTRKTWLHSVYEPGRRKTN